MTTRLQRPAEVVFRSVPGAEYEHVTAHRDVRLGASESAGAIDGGRLDRTLKRHASEVRVSRAFYARRGLGRPGDGHREYDDVESSLGLSRTFRVDLDAHTDVRDLVSALRDEASIEMAAPSYLVVGDAARVDGDVIDRARAQVGAHEALQSEPGDSALIIGLIDSGVDLQHPGLVARLRPGVSSVALPAEDLGNGVVVLQGARIDAQDVDDDEGHGTACAGILSASNAALPPGIAGAARLLPVRGLCAARLGASRSLTVVGSVEDINSGWKSAIDLGARVLNLSFGTAEEQLLEDDPVPHVEMVRYALARGCVLIAASGNTGTWTRYFPAALPGVIAVGAVGKDDEPSSFTTRGDHVALSAPGDRVLTAGLGGRIDRQTGTSFAAPFVTGAVALLQARAARHSHPLDSSTVRRLLRDTARRFTGSGDTRGCGAGILDIPAALLAVDRLATGTTATFAHALQNNSESVLGAPPSDAGGGQTHEY